MRAATGPQRAALMLYPTSMVADCAGTEIFGDLLEQWLDKLSWIVVEGRRIGIG